MAFADKLMQLRRQQGLSQEQLADRLGVTRQSVSKWESGASMPELGKIIILSKQFSVSVDYLVKDEILSDGKAPRNMEKADAGLGEKIDSMERYIKGPEYEYVSKTKIFGIPLVCIRFSRHMGKGCVAKGVIAIGGVAVGVVSIGGFSVGLFSIGGTALGAFALGGLAFGLVAAGGVAFGLAAFGAVAIGVYAGGVTAVGREIAVGVAAVGKTSIGYDCSGEHCLAYYPGITRNEVCSFILTHHPKLIKPLAEWLAFLGSAGR